MALPASAPAGLFVCCDCAFLRSSQNNLVQNYVVFTLLLSFSVLSHVDNRVSQYDCSIRFHPGLRSELSALHQSTAPTEAMASLSMGSRHIDPGCLE